MEELVTKLDELNKRRFELSQNAKKIAPVSAEEVATVIATALKKLEWDLREPQTTDENHLLLKSLIETIVFTPTSTRYGEDAVITLQKNRWPTFYNLVN